MSLTSSFPIAQPKQTSMKGRAFEEDNKRKKQQHELENSL